MRKHPSVRQTLTFVGLSFLTLIPLSPPPEAAKLSPLEQLLAECDQDRVLTFDEFFPETCVVLNSHNPLPDESCRFVRASPILQTFCISFSRIQPKIVTPTLYAPVQHAGHC